MADRWEREHFKTLLETEKTLLSLYQESIDRIYTYAAIITFTTEFVLANYPLLNTVVQQEIVRLTGAVESLLFNGIRGAWERSSTKFGEIVSERYFDRGQLPDSIRQIVYSPTQDALEQWIKRRDSKTGLNLSQRVHNYTQEAFKREIEENLFTGIQEGKSAAQMARQHKQYLKYPDKLFRRVRDAEGKLRLSKAAKAFKPGQGVYRSSYKNALRLTATEINMAYRRADIERYQNTPFILGYKVSLSQSHPKFDICDYLDNEYPVSFIFVGWHPRCLCYVTPIMPDMKEFLEYQQYVLRGEGDKYPFKRITEMPKGFISYMEENVERFLGYKNKPYFMKDNPNVFKNIKPVKKEPN